MRSLRSILLFCLIALVFLTVAGTGAVADRLFVFRPLDALVHRMSGNTSLPQQGLRSGGSIAVEERIPVITDASSQSVVTISLNKTRTEVKGFYLDPLGQFAVPQQSGSTDTVKQDIGTGFVVEKGGLIVTNNHVVGDVTATYKVITKENKEYEVKKIYRDALNDLAILKVDASLAPLAMGDSEKLKVGQSVIAIGTALGKFRHTVTTGVISGLGRGLYASGGGFSERLDNVIQTDAAINPGNSGGPLINMNGEVIGVNVATSAQGQNIGFAIPIHVVRESLEIFQKTGQFERPTMGVRYQLLPSEVAVLNEIPQGAYIREVIAGSPAERAGLQSKDIIVKLNGKPVLDETSSIARVIQLKKIGDVLQVEYWRAGEVKQVEVVLEKAKE